MAVPASAPEQGGEARRDDVARVTCVLALEYAEAKPSTCSSQHPPAEVFDERNGDGQRGLEPTEISLPSWKSRNGLFARQCFASRRIRERKTLRSQNCAGNGGTNRDYINNNRKFERGLSTKVPLQRTRTGSTRVLDYRG